MRSVSIDSAPPPRVVERTFSGLTSSVRNARLFVRESVADVGVEAALLGDLELAASELVTNAIEHGPHAPIRVGVAADVASIRLSVESVRTSSALADPSTWASPLPAVRTGRGLAIVRSVSDHVAVEATDDHVTVHCTFVVR